MRIGSNLMKAAAIAMATLALAACRERWTLYFYPDRTDLSQYVTVGPFSSLEDCEAAAEGMEKLAPSDPGPDYECAEI